MKRARAPHIKGYLRTYRAWHILFARILPHKRKSKIRTNRREERSEDQTAELSFAPAARRFLCLRWHSAFNIKPKCLDMPRFKTVFKRNNSAASIFALCALGWRYMCVCTHNGRYSRCTGSSKIHKLGGPPFKRFMQIACRNRALSLSRRIFAPRAHALRCNLDHYLCPGFAHFYWKPYREIARSYAKVERFFSDHANSSVSYKFSNSASPNPRRYFFLDV
jgi:hypothetical protein